MAAKPRGPTQKGIDLPSHFANRLHGAGLFLADAARFAPLVFYFWAYWSNKETLRRGVRTSALGFLTASSFVLLAEVLAELTARKFVLIPRRYGFEVASIVGFTLSVAILVFHHRREFRHRHAEFVLAERLWEFMMRRNAITQDECIAMAIRLFRDIFARFGIAHVSVALPVNGELIIDPRHVYPPEDSPSFYQRLPLDDGVGGYVYKDGRPRYVPRLFYPVNGFRRRLLLFRLFFFPHALVFEFGKDKQGRIDVVKPKLDFDVFKTSFDDPFVFKSFVSVPLKSRDEIYCIGVLNFDFVTTDPLIRVDIKTAVVLGFMLADELERIRSLQSPVA